MVAKHSESPLGISNDDLELDCGYVTSRWSSSSRRESIATDNSHVITFKMAARYNLVGDVRVGPKCEKYGTFST